ncbi:hypothetical protein MKOR_07210 [Mycolicibacillus koreensis]|nr:hypothetical protein MKOR_07210 [Mycolicibacillus koreensis]
MNSTVHNRGSGNVVRAMSTANPIPSVAVPAQTAPNSHTVFHNSGTVVGAASWERNSATLNPARNSRYAAGASAAAAMSSPGTTRARGARRVETLR